MIVVFLMHYVDSTMICVKHHSEQRPKTDLFAVQHIAIYVQANCLKRCLLVAALYKNALWIYALWMHCWCKTLAGPMTLFESSQARPF